MSRDIGFYLDLMDLIQRGSVTLDFSRAKSIAKITVSRDEVQVSISVPGLTYDIFHPILVVESDGKEVAAQKRGDKWKSNTMMIKDFLMLFQGVEQMFVEKGKTLRIKFKGKEVLVIGPGQKSLIARFVGMEHVSLPSKVHLVGMIKDFWVSKPEPDRI